MTGQSQVSLEEVVRRFDGPPEVQALGPVNLDITSGEFFSIVGPSGCGKSTLLDVVAGLATPTSGSVRFEGKELHGEVPDGIGVVFQEDSSMPWLTVRDNVAFGLRTSGLPKNEVADRVEQDRGLDDHLEHPVAADRLADGQDVREDLVVPAVDRGADVDHHVDLIRTGIHSEACLGCLHQRVMLARRESRHDAGARGPGVDGQHRR